MLRQAITLTYYIEAAGRRRPGGDHGVNFLCVLLVLCVVLCTKFFLCCFFVCCVVHEVTVG